MVKKRVADIIRRRYNKTKELSQDAFDRVEVNKNLYKGILNADDTYEWDYSLVDPHIFPLVRSYLSRSNPSMSAIRLDVTRPDQYEVRQINQDFLNWEIGELMSTSLFYRMYFSAYLAGRGYLKTGWKYEKAIKIQEKNEDGVITRVKILRDIVNRANAEFVRYNNILVPDRNNPDMYTQPYLLELIQQRVGDMLDENESLKEKGERPYWNEKFLNNLKKSGVTNKLLEYEMERATDADAKDELAFRSATIPLMCMHTLEGDVFYMPLEGDDTIINEDTTNRYWHGHYPYITYCPFLEDDEYHSLALVDVAGDLQIAATEILNQTLTNIRQINNDMWIAGTPAAQTPDWQFRKRPDGVIRVMGDVSQIQQIRTQDNTRPAIAFAEVLGQKIEKAGGISSLYQSGVGSQQINQTARGAQIIDQNIDTNMKMLIDLFGEQVLKKMGEHFLELNAQYVTEEQTFAVTGKRGVRELLTIRPEEVTANFIITVNSDKIQKQTPASRQASLQNSITVLQNIQNQSQGAVQVDLIPVVEALIDATPEMEDVAEVVISIDEKIKRDIAMLERGQLPEIKIRDPHEDLIVGANTHFQPAGAFSPEVVQVVEQYVQQHLRYLQSEQEVAAMKSQQQQSLMATIAPQTTPGGAPAPGGVPAPTFDPEQAAQQGQEVQTYNLGNIV